MRRLAAVAVLALIATPIHAIEMPQPKPMTGPLFNGSVAVEAKSYVEYEFTITASATSPKLRGRVIASGGTGNDIVILVLSEAEYLNWKNNHTASTLYNSGQITAADLDVELPKPGRYHVIFSNVFSALTPKTVSGSIEAHWVHVPSPEELAAAQAIAEAEVHAARREKTMNLSIIIAALVSFVAIVGGAAAWVIANRKTKDEDRAAA